MKTKFILLASLLMSITIGMNSKVIAQTTKTISICDIPLGISKTQFYEQLSKESNIYNNLKNILDVERAKIECNSFDIKNTDIVYSVGLWIEVEYEFQLREKFITIQSILSAKYGKSEQSFMPDGKSCICYNLSYGQITMWRESATRFAIFFVDYGSLRKAKKELYNAF